MLKNYKNKPLLPKARLKTSHFLRLYYYEHWLISNDAKPATEEQKEEFFKKLTECGYVWHPEIKTIVKKNFDKKIYLSDDDIKMFDKTIWKLQDLIKYTTSPTFADDIRENIKWLQDFKERISK